MRIVHTSDWHIGKTLNDYPLLQDQEACLFAFADRIHALCTDALIISGDIYDRSVPSAEAVSLLDRLFSYLTGACGIEVFAIAGNHDSRERIDFGSRMMDSAGLHLVGSVRRPVSSFDLKKGDETVTIWMLPYFELHHIRALFPEDPPKNLQEAFELCLSQIHKQADFSHPQILAAHGFYTAGGTADETSVGGGEHLILRKNPFDYVALGHLHGCHSAGGDMIRYSGSPLKYSVDEAAQEKRFLMLDFQDNILQSIQEESFAAEKDVRMIRGTLDELCDRSRQSGFSDYVFAELSDECIRVGAIQRLKAVFPNALGLKYTNLQSSTPAHSAANPIARKADPQALFADFFQSVTNRALTDAERAYIRETADKQEKGDFRDTGTA